MRSVTCSSDTIEVSYSTTKLHLDFSPIAKKTAKRTSSGDVYYMKESLDVNITTDSFSAELICRLVLFVFTISRKMGL